eukprot:RCo005009
METAEIAEEVPLSLSYVLASSFSGFPNASTRRFTHRIYASQVPLAVWVSTTALLPFTISFAIVFRITQRCMVLLLFLLSSLLYAILFASMFFDQKTRATAISV